jgi:NAD(P)-dependent dehydrogenase (short-subunit alcohol dehydrogenase family)
MSLDLDVIDFDQVKGAVARGVERFGRIDVLVNNAAASYLSTIEDGAPDTVKTLFDINVLGAAALMRAVLPDMRRRREGTIVNISSASAVLSHPGLGYYGATKAALRGLSDALRQEVDVFGVRVLVVELGFVRGTNMLQHTYRSPRNADYDKAGSPSETWIDFLDQLSCTPELSVGKDCEMAAKEIVDCVMRGETRHNIVLDESTALQMLKTVQRLRQEYESWLQ